jgi:hypothetical protein
MQFGKDLAFAVLSTLIFCLGLQSCEYNNEDELFPPGPCATDTITYTGVIEPLMADKCYECHDDDNRLGNVDLEGYNNLVFYVEDGSLLGSVKHDAGFSPMPDGRDQLSDCEIEQLETWISEGAQNN